MATRKRSSASRPKARSGARAAGIPAGMIEGVQQIWLAGMGAISRAQRDGPAAFQEAVTEGLKLLERSRSNAERVVRDVFETAQGSMHSRLDSARTQANETWETLEALFQNRVQRSLMQIGVPTADEVRRLTRRVAELNDSVKALTRRQAKSRKRAAGHGARKPARQPGRRRRA
jgi:poly(hydroxyalkanoate) granule-associated protein